MIEKTFLKQVKGWPFPSKDKVLVRIKKDAQKRRIALYFKKGALSAADLKEALEKHREFFPFFKQILVHKNWIYIRVFSKKDMSPWFWGLHNFLGKMILSMQKGVHIKIESIEDLLPLDVPKLIAIVQNTKGSVNPYILIVKAKLVVLQKSDYRCTHCGNTESLTIDHAVNMRMLGYEKEDPSYYHPDACRALCTHCHFVDNISDSWFSRLKRTLRTLAFALKHREVLQKAKYSSRSVWVRAFSTVTQVFVK